MLKVTFIIILALLYGVGYSQNNNLILNKKQSSKWCDSLATLPIEKQMIMIRERILSDTNVFVKEYYPDGIIVKDSLGNRVYGDGKPIIIINGLSINIENCTNKKEILKLTALINSKYISNILLLKGNDTTRALYGWRGGYGVIIMTLSKKSLLKQFKSLNFSCLD